jgi:transposase
MRAKRAPLQQALTGTRRPLQQVILPQLLAHIDCLQASMAQVEAAIGERLLPSAQAVELRQSSPGGNATAAAPLGADLGVERTRLPSAAHLAAWAGGCPGNQQRGGKRLSGTTRRGDPWLNAVVCAVVWANARSQTSDLGAPCRRLSRRRGIDTALSAVAHSLVVIVSPVLTTHQPSYELGPDSFDSLQQAQLERHHMRRLAQLGYTLTLAPATGI